MSRASWKEGSIASAKPEDLSYLRGRRSYQRRSRAEGSGRTFAKLRRKDLGIGSAPRNFANWAPSDIPINSSSKSGDSAVGGRAVSLELQPITYSITEGTVNEIDGSIPRKGICYFALEFFRGSL